MIVEATAFATIVSLIGQFRSERNASKGQNFEEFLAWLIDNNHTELKNLLEANTQTTIGIKALLGENQKILLDRLSRIDDLLVSIVGNIDGFSDLANGLKRESLISEQAISILRQMEEKQASTILESQNIGSTKTAYMMIDGNGGDIQYEEPRFIEDDLLTLVELGLMRHDLNSQSANLYKITRTASKYIDLIDFKTG